MRKKDALEDYLNMPWHFAVEPSEWEGEKGYWAWVSELPQCSTFGRTQSEAISIVADSLPSYLEAALESKASIPTPARSERNVEEAGGTIVLRLPKSLHIGLKRAAETENTSLNQFALFALTKMVYQTTRPSNPSNLAKSARRSVPRSAKSGNFLGEQKVAVRKDSDSSAHRSKQASVKSKRARVG